MKKFKLTIKEAIKIWNEKNPSLKPKSIKSIADELGIFPQQLSQWIKNGNKQLDLHLNVIFLSKEEKVINQNWESYQKQEIKGINRLNQIKTILECEIWNLVTIIESEK